MASMALILAALSVFVYVRLDSQLRQAVDLGLQARAGAIASGIGQQGVAIGDTPDAGPATVSQVIDATGRVEETSGPTTPFVPAESLRAIRGPTFLQLPPTRSHEATRLFVLPTNEGHVLYVLVGSSMAEPRQTLAHLRLLLMAGGPAALALASITVWLLAGAALRPLDRMREEAAAISISEPARRLPVPDTDDEVARLGRTLNSLLSRLEDARSRERRLLDDASHEIRTPLGILKAELDLALSRSRTPEEMEEALRSASEETDRLARLAEDLLVLSRARNGQLGIHRAEVSLRSLLNRTCDAHRARFEGAGLSIGCHAADADVRIDPMRVRQALDNLLDNARRFSPQGGVIGVRGEVSGAQVRIVVHNPGPGFSDQVLPHAFEPFVHDDRGSNQDGSGLGLAIVRAVAEAHGGSVTAENVQGGGARLTMTLASEPRPSRPAPVTNP